MAVLAAKDHVASASGCAPRSDDGRRVREALPPIATRLHQFLDAVLRVKIAVVRQRMNEAAPPCESRVAAA